MDYKVEFIAINDLKPYERNAKKHPQEQIDRIAESIKQFGFRQNLVIDKNNCVIIGHGRLLAAKQLGIEVVPCIRVEDLTEQQIRALRLVDNKVAESGWDHELLDFELSEISDLNMEQFGFDIFADEEPETKERENINYHENISVVIDCENEEQAEMIFEKLQSEGYECHISTL